MTVRRFLSRAMLFLSILTSIAAADAVRAARPVINVANARWTHARGTGSVDSNAVVLQVEDDEATINVYAPGQPAGEGASAVPTANSICRGMATPSAAAANGSDQAALVQTRQVMAGDDLIFTLHYSGGNTDPARLDTMIAVLTTGSGDRETLTVFETGPATGAFTGRIGTTLAQAAPVHDNCILTVLSDLQDRVTITYERETGGAAIASTMVEVLVDPFGRVFDSEDGGFVSGVRVSFVDAATGAPARVFAPDGKTAWPASVITGQPVTDAAGIVYASRPGRFQFPLAPAGTYRLVVDPPGPYKAPSSAAPAALALLVRPNGRPFAISDASYGKPFVLAGTAALRVDIPIDGARTPVELAKTASRTSAARGDVVLYTITVRNPDTNRIRRDLTIVDALPPAMRLRPATVKVSGGGQSYDVALAPDGRTLTVVLKRIPAAATRSISYALDVRPDARPGQAINRVSATDVRGNAVSASVAVRVTDETVAGRMTIIGRVLEASCASPMNASRGLSGVRVMLEDGSYAVTDRDGRYHFNGVLPGTHVVQVDDAARPDLRFANCTRSTRAAGSPTSRFVEGQGGTLAIADFHAEPARAGRPVATGPADLLAPVSLPAPAAAGPASDRDAAGAERDWFKDGTPNIAWLFPEADHNPRSPALRVAIRHLPLQSVRLSANGRPVDPITLDGTRIEPNMRYGVTLWRGIPLQDGGTELAAEVIDADSRVVATLKRTVHFTNAAAHADYLPARSRLRADGIERPVIAVRITDRNGRPLRHGMTGQVSVPAPYEAAAQIDAEQARMLSGLDRAAPTWRVNGDDGIALIELAPTTTSGALALDFEFRDRDQIRRQRLETWLSPGDRPWTIVGLAEGRIGQHALADKVEPLKDAGAGLNAGGRLALYATGRVRGSWLLTFAYDSAKRRDEQRLQGTIDPATYYTVYADRTERRFDAASARKLYLKLERAQFYALFGDFVTGLNDTELGRYNRAGTGVKAEARSGRFAGTAFAARFDTLHRRDEIQGNGLSGPYRLSARQILANSERIVIEVRDRLHSERIADRRTLVRFIDYDLDYETGTVRFSAPVLSRSSTLDPQFIVVDYELYQATTGAVSAGGRAGWTGEDGRVRLGVSAVSDSDSEAEGRTSLAAADLRVRLGDGIELRAEMAASYRNSRIKSAYLAEAAYHDGRIDARTYVRSQDPQFGVAQQNAAERGRRKAGLDGRVRITDTVALSGSMWIDDDVSGNARRLAARAGVEYRANGADLRFGILHSADRTDAERRASSTLLEAGATRSFLNNTVQVDLATSIALAEAESIDFPARHRIGLRYQATSDVALVGAYEIARGERIDARTARVGFDLKPWSGARLTTGLGQQDLQEYGRRAFAAYGLAQSLQVSGGWSVDATLDGNRTLGGIDARAVVNPRQPVASGGFVGDGTLVSEDFSAVTLGATYRTALWSTSARVERRWADSENREGATFGLVRQLGDGQVFGALAAWTNAQAAAGLKTETLSMAVSGASRPSDSQFALFGKFEYREDEVRNAGEGKSAAVLGVPLTVTGDALSRRLTGSLSADWAPYGRDDQGLFQRHEFGLFIGSRYVFDRIDALDLEGASMMIGVDARIGIGERFEIGMTATVLGQLSLRNLAYAAGPSCGVRLGRDLLLQGGWNVVGFVDRDFSAARTTRVGPFVSARMKFDQHSLPFSGLAR